MPGPISTSVEAVSTKERAARGVSGKPLKGEGKWTRASGSKVVMLGFYQAWPISWFSRTSEPSLARLTLYDVIPQTRSFKYLNIAWFAVL